MVPRPTLTPSLHQDRHLKQPLDSGPVLDRSNGCTKRDSLRRTYDPIRVWPCTELTYISLIRQIWRWFSFSPGCDMLISWRVDFEMYVCRYDMYYLIMLLDVIICYSGINNFCCSFWKQHIVSPDIYPRRETPPFEDVFPTRTGDFHCHLSFRKCITLISHL